MTRSIPTPTRRARTAIVLTATAAALTFGLSGCYEEKICGEGQPPMVSPEGGGACLLPGQTVPPGWRTYQPGHTPEHPVEDERKASASWLSTPAPGPATTTPATKPASTPAATPASTPASSRH